MSNTLVVYYSVFGNTKTVAQTIAEAEQAALREIELVKPYSKVGAYTKGVIHSIHVHQKLPEIKSSIDLAPYDTIYIGAPVWNYTVNIALQSWLSQVDLSGKRVIPFFTNDGDLGDSFEKMSQLCEKAATLEKGISVSGARHKSPEEIRLEVVPQLRKAV